MIKNEPSFACANEYSTIVSNLNSLISEKNKLMSSNLGPEYVEGIADAKWCGNPSNSNFINKCCPAQTTSDLCKVFSTDTVFDLAGTLWTKESMIGGIKYGGNGRGDENPKLAAFYNSAVATNPPYLRLWYPGFKEPVEVKLPLNAWRAEKIKDRTHLQFMVENRVFQAEKSGREGISEGDPYPTAAQFVNCLKLKS
jgi:hypothetical protein